MAKDRKNEAGFIFSEPGLWVLHHLFRLFPKSWCQTKRRGQLYQKKDMFRQLGTFFHEAAQFCSQIESKPKKALIVEVSQG